MDSFLIHGDGHFLHQQPVSAVPARQDAAQKIAAPPQYLYRRPDRFIPQPQESLQYHRPGCGRLAFPRGCLRLKISTDVSNRQARHTGSGKHLDRAFRRHRLRQRSRRLDKVTGFRQLAIQQRKRFLIHLRHIHRLAAFARRRKNQYRRGSLAALGSVSRHQRYL